MSTIVGADIGRSFTKIYTEVGKKIVKNSFKTYASEEKTIFNDENSLTVNGKKYLVGVNGVGKTILTDHKSNDNVFEVCLLKGLTDIETDINEFDIVIGYPIKDYSDYNSISIKDLSGKSYNVIDAKGIARKITINKVLVQAEAVQFTREEGEIKDGDFLVIDIGGKTVDAVLYKDGIVSTVRSYDKGINKFFEHVSDIISDYYRIDYSASLVETAFKKGYLVINKKRVPLNQDIKLELEKFKWFESIIMDIKKHYDWDATESMFIGGGSELFKKFLEKIEVELYEDSVFANAKAFYDAGVLKYGEH